MRPLWPVAASAALALSVLAAPTLAENDKTMNGIACHPRQPGDVPFLLRSNSGGIRSSGSDSVFVVCPVIKDLASGRLRRAEVRVIDQNPVFDVGCDLSTNRSNGDVQQFQARRSIGSSSAVQSLKFGGQNAVANGSYNLVCVLPPISSSFGISAVIQYTVVEE